MFRRKKNNWYKEELDNLLKSIHPSEEQGSRVMTKLVRLIQILSQKADE